MENNLVKKFYLMNRNNKLSHAYLIYNNSLEYIQNELLQIANDCLGINCKSLFNTIDIHIINPIEGNINKNQILDLQEKIKTRSQINQNILYIINGAENMNKYASNSLLKILEEPEQNIFAILITNNLEKILPTIKSRCILINYNNISKKIYDCYEKDIIDNSILFSKILNFQNKKNIVDIHNIFKNYNRHQLKQLVELSIYFYKDVLNREPEYFIFNKNDILDIKSTTHRKKILERMVVLNNSLEKLEYNLNLSLLIDKIVWKLEGERE